MVKGEIASMSALTCCMWAMSNGPVDPFLLNSQVPLVFCATFAIYTRLDPDHWRAEYPGGGSGMFREADIRAYDAERDARPAAQSRRAKATAPQKSSRSRYAIDPEAIAARRLPEKAPLVTSAANPHYQKHFDRLFALARAGDWDAVRDYKVTGSNSYSKMVVRYRQDLLAVHAASEAPQ
jgi:hypothetical protein